MDFFDAPRRFLRLSAGDRWLTVRAYATLLAVDLGLRGLGFHRLVSFVHSTSAGPFREPTVLDIRRARRYADRIESAARYQFVPALCLHRSLALHAWLRREGLPTELRIGVVKAENELKAHAWVELGEYVLNDDRRAVATFVPLSTIDGDRPDWTSTSRETALIPGSKELRWQQ